MTYLSIDIEADGPIPGDNNMLSLGAAAFDSIGKLIGTFYVKLLPRPDTFQDKETMAWWAKNPEAYKEATSDAVPARNGVYSFVHWLKSLPQPITAIGYPATYDFMFVYWYLRHYGHQSPFGFQALDIKTLAMAKLGISFKKTSKRNMPKEWFKGCGKHTHKAVDDAIEQGQLFFNIINWSPK